MKPPKPKRKQPPLVHKMPESAFFESKGPAAGDKRYWRQVPAIVAAICVFIVFLGFGYSGTYFSADEATLAKVGAVTGVSPPYVVLTQWHPGGRDAVVIPTDEGPLPRVEQWYITSGGAATLTRQLMGDPRPSQRFSMVCGYVGALISAGSMVGMILSGRNRPRRKNPAQYAPPEFKNPQAS